MSTFSEIAKKYQKIIVGFLVIATGSTLTLLFDGVDKLRGIMEADQNIKRVEAKLDFHINMTDSLIHMNEDVTEMDWEFARNITDNLDSLDVWIFADDNGAVFEVDIRENAEGMKMAFVHGPMFIIYPIYTDTNGRYYIMLHHSAEQNTYLYRQTE